MIPNVTSPPVIRLAATAYPKNSRGSPAPSAAAHQPCRGTPGSAEGGWLWEPS